MNDLLTLTSRCSLRWGPVKREALVNARVSAFGVKTTTRPAGAADRWRGRTSPERRL